MSRNPEEGVCEEKRFQKLFHEISPDLYRFLYHKFGAGNNPSDLVQEAFLRLWKNCHKVTVEKARGFLFTVANNKMLNEIAREKTVTGFRKEKQKSYTMETPQFRMEEEEYSNKLEAALGELSEDQRITFMLNRVEGKKHQEIADMLGISRKAVEKRIYTALAILREKLEGF